MSAYWLDWLGLVGRWLHFVVGIAWIGSSFYFVWLDNHLRPPAAESDRERGVRGELWSVHGGGFYHAQKYRLAPPAIPETLHWFKWEAYSTWLSGMFLLALIYWYGAEIYLIDESVSSLSRSTAIIIAVAWLAGGWIVYDALCRSRLAKSDRLLGAILLAVFTAAAWGLCQLFSGRGAFIHFGAMLGTIMVANVFFVIIPGQKRMVAAAADGRRPDPADGARGKQRSVHNTYFTLPVLFAMISNHYAMTYAHDYNWLILAGLSLAGTLVRVWFVQRHSGRAAPLPAAAAVLLLAAIALAIAPRGLAGGSGETATLADVRAVIESRCVTCHAAEPAHEGFAAAPGGVLLETDAQILAEADRIHQQTVVLRAMPVGNLTAITPEERALVDRWYRAVSGE